MRESKKWREREIQFIWDVRLERKCACEYWHIKIKLTGIKLIRTNQAFKKNALSKKTHQKTKTKRAWIRGDRCHLRLEMTLSPNYLWTESDLRTICSSIQAEHVPWCPFQLWQRKIVEKIVSFWFVLHSSVFQNGAFIVIIQTLFFQYLLRCVCGGK